MPESPEQTRKSSREAPPAEVERETPRPKVGRVFTLDDDDATPTMSGAKASEDLPGSFPTTESRDRSPAQVDIPPAELKRSETPTIDDVNDMLRGSPFYQQPHSETVSDIAVADLNRPEPQTGHGFVEDREVPETPGAAPHPRQSKSERRRMERAISLENSTTPIVDEPKQTESESGHVFDYLVDENGTRDMPASGTKASFDEPQDFPKPKRSATFDDTALESSRSKSKTDYASDPEDWERSSPKKGDDKKRSSKNDVGTGAKAALIGAATGAAVAAAAAAADDDFYSSEKRSRKSKRESEVYDNDDDMQSVTSSSTSKSKRKSKRQSEAFDDDDTRSVASSESRKKSSKDKEKEKRSSGGIWGSIFGASKSDLSTSSKKSSKSTKSEGRAEADRSEDGEKRKKRRSKGEDFDDVASATSEPTRKSRRDIDPLAQLKQTATDSRDQSVDDSFVSADEAARDVNNDQEPSF